MPTPNCACRRRSTRPRAAGSAIDFGASVTGAIPVKVAGRVGDNAKDDRMNVEADLTPVKIDNLLPGWVKPAGKAGARHLHAA